MGGVRERERERALHTHLNSWCSVEREEILQKRLVSLRDKTLHSALIPISACLLHAYLKPLQVGVN